MENQKFTIGAVQQNKLIELGLDIKDAFILTYLKDLIGSKNKIISKIVKEEVYYWVKYENIIKYLPILKIDNLKVISRRLANYEKLGLIKRHVHKNYNKADGRFKGAYTFLSLTINFSYLFEISKVTEDLTEIEEVAKEMGLTFKSKEINTFNHENLKVPMEHRGYSKVLSIEGTQKFPQYTPNNNTPNNIKPTTTISKDNNYSQNKKSSSRYEFLNKFNLSPGTLRNINSLPGLTEEKFKNIFLEIKKQYDLGKIKSFEAVLFKALKGEWNLIPNSTKKENPLNIEKVAKAHANDCLSYLDIGWDKDQVYSKLSSDTFNKPEVYILAKEIVDDYFQRRNE